MANRCTDAARATLNRLYDWAAALVRGLYHLRIDGPPVLDLARDFPGGAAFAAAWPALRREALALEVASIPRFHELMPQQAAISAVDRRDWRMFLVKAYGVTIAENAARTPVLARLVADHPEVLSATLSFLAPHKHVPEHRGPFRGVLRYYLGLSVPPAADGEPGTTLTVSGVEHRIGEGQSLLWDDTFAHEVRNATDSVRIALLLDVRRRGMPIDMEVLSRVLIAAAGSLVRLRYRARGVRV